MLGLVEMDDVCEFSMKWCDVCEFSMKGCDVYEFSVKWSGACDVSVGVKELLFVMFVTVEVRVSRNRINDSHVRNPSVNYWNV